MKKELVLLQNNNLITTSEIVAEGVKKSHKSVIQLIKDYENDLNDFGTLSFLKRESTGGRPAEFYYLNEQQVTFLITLMRNTKIVVEFKKTIIKQFYLMKKWILEQQTLKANEQYKITRNQSKIYRLAETDEIKKLVQYAKDNGSKSAEKYYIHYSNLAKAYFDIQIKLKSGQNFRDILNIEQLTKIMWADMIIKETINEGIYKKMFYKDIYKLAKERIIENVILIGGKELVPFFENKLIEA